MEELAVRRLLGVLLLQVYTAHRVRAFQADCVLLSESCLPGTQRNITHAQLVVGRDLRDI